ncbi:hypothetical protein CTEN210_05810 [Chaetoceros tenuissimus]|uniref:Leucine-rich repeat domain-containing protein n=1 Tax=Chaetoceros tenuissimus TaxID=426638 RepID=A0AAD3CRB2_9STRA|nr:hypothetical protein CTEN210_05810 [Chaetoceros tenuissimus]
MRVEQVDGLLTLFYDGSIIDNADMNYEHYCTLDNEEDRSEECKKYVRERYSWQQIIVMEGVSIIPDGTFYLCKNIKRVIFSSTVIRIEESAFLLCSSLVFIKLSIHLEYIGEKAFDFCNLKNVFLPPTCECIGKNSFARNENLTIFHVPRRVCICKNAVKDTKLKKIASTLSEEDQKNWIKSINDSPKCLLHKICCAYQPTAEAIHQILQDRGLEAFYEKNSIGISPVEYLQENPFTDITEVDIVRNYKQGIIPPNTIETLPFMQGGQYLSVASKMKVGFVGGLFTLFYDGSDIYDYDLSTEYFEPGHPGNRSESFRKWWHERQTWQQVIVLEGVTVIPEQAFFYCKNIERIIFSDTVIRVEDLAVCGCSSLVYIKLSNNLEFIGDDAFVDSALKSLFIPPSCREVDCSMFQGVEGLEILHVPRQTVLRWNRGIVCRHDLCDDLYLQYPDFDSLSKEEQGNWIKNINSSDKHTLHRICCSFQPTVKDVVEVMQDKGVRAFYEENDVGFTPSHYLDANPFAEISEMEIIRTYTMRMMGEWK